MFNLVGDVFPVRSDAPPADVEPNVYACVTEASGTSPRQLCIFFKHAVEGDDTCWGALALPLGPFVGVPVEFSRYLAAMLKAQQQSIELACARHQKDQS